MNPGELQIFGSVWLAFSLWAVAEVSLTRGEECRGGCARPLWTLGALVMVWHFAASFHFRHGWSHAAAVAETARQTGAALGVNWGGGVWFNYALLAWWLASAGRSWLGFARWERPGWVRWVRRACFWIMWFNGAFVFAHGAGRGFGLVACLGVLGAWATELRRTRLARRDPAGILRAGR